MFKRKTGDDSTSFCHHHFSSPPSLRGYCADNDGGIVGGGGGSDGSGSGDSSAAAQRLQTRMQANERARPWNFAEYYLCLPCLFALVTEVDLYINNECSAYVYPYNTSAFTASSSSLCLFDFHLARHIYTLYAETTNRSRETERERDGEGGGVVIAKEKWARTHTHTQEHLYTLHCCAVYCVFITQYIQSHIL